MRRSLSEALDQALAVRAALLARTDTTACRLFNGRADGIDGLVIEKLGEVLTIQLHEGRLTLPERDVRTAVEALCDRLGARSAYRKWFVRDRAAISKEAAAEQTRAEPWIGRPVEPEIPVLENGLTFIVRAYDGFSVGLFLEHRETRCRVRELAAGRRVLNTFAYTCGFTVAAAAGGAVSTASVDLHNRYLEWGKQNLAANRIVPESHLFFNSDTFEFYKRAKRQNRRYDLIVLDPPTFSRTRRPERVFVLAEQLDDLVRGAVELLEPGGYVLLSTNDRGIARERLEQAMKLAGDGRACMIVDRPGLPVDFAGDADYSKSVIAVYA